MIQQKVRKKNTCFNGYFQYSQSKITGLNEMWSLRYLKCELVNIHYYISENQALF